MSTLRNRVQLIGHLGMDPEVITYGDGKKLVKFSLATSEFYRSGDGKSIKNTQWHNIVIFGGATGDFAEKYLTKGKEIGVEGKLVHKSYDDKSGNKRYSTDIVVNELMLISKSEK